jgi:NADH-quinone oxidoreductase subunit L
MAKSFELIFLVIGLPILGFLIQCFWGKAIIDRMGIAAGRKTVGAIATSAVAASFAIGVMILLDLAKMAPGDRLHIRTMFDWINIAGLHIPVELRIDTLSMTMVMIITGIGSLIHLYATGYMAEEQDYPRFFSYLNLFVAFMLTLVLGNNLALLFIGWEGVGLCSYLLIGFWYKDFANSGAANKAFITNRVGDVGLALGMFLIAFLLSTNAKSLGITDSRWLSYDVILPNIGKIFETNPGMATAIALCLFVGACGKSAQFPLYLWLPDAMAGPTPVSALIHAATMVTAGVFLLTRMQVVFAASAVASSIVVIVGLFTAIFAALIAFGQTDIKKVLAYSTVSQLGFMFVACGVGAYWVGMFHVITHAFFKALLFLGSGAVIHAMAHDQDMRNYGSLSKYIKITWATMLIGYLAIAGLPYTSGWFSKEEIIHVAIGSKQAMLNGVNIGYYAGWIAFGAALLTAIYMTRMMMLTFGGGQQRWKLIPAGAHDHADHHDDHAHEAHSHSDHAHQGEDTEGFFYTDDEMAAMHSHEDHDDHHHALDETHVPHEVPPSMWIPLVVLAFFSLFSGVWLKDYFGWFGQKKMLLENWLTPVETWRHGHHHAEYHPHEIPYEQIVAMLGYSIGIAGIIIGVAWYFRGLPKSEGFDLKKWNPLRVFAGNQFGYDKTVVESFSEGGNAFGTFLWKFVDNKIVDGAVNGLGTVLGGLSKGAGFVQTGLARGYALMMLLGSAAILGYVIYALAQVGGRG